MDEKRALFNEQMNEWVSRQGLWFQLRHAADGQSIVSRVVRLGLRLMILLVLCALVFWVYLEQRVGKDEFKEEVRASIEETLRGRECVVGSIRRDRNIATISHIEMEGTDQSFFHQLNAGILRLSMKLTDGFVGVWNGGVVSIHRLDINLKGGAGSDSAAAEAYRAIFAEHQSFRFEGLEVQKTSLSWGYSANNRGEIRDSHMTAARDGDGWRLQFKGGTFSQNWIRHYEIGKMTVVCDDLGVHIKEAELLADGGSLTFQVDVGAGGQPEALGSVVINSMPLKALLPYRFSEWVGGRISGAGTVSGSTNSQEGIALDLKLSLEDGDELILRDSLPLLSALSVGNVYNSYRKIEFTEGSCHIRTGGDQLHVDDINFKAGDLFDLKGSVDARPPNHAEIAKALEIEDVRVVTDIIEKNWKVEDEILDAADSSSSRSEEAKGVGEVIAAAAEEKALSEMAILTTAVLTEINMRRFGGSVKIGLKGDAFDKSPELKKDYPADPETGRIWLDVPLSGKLQTLTLEQAKKLHVLGGNRR